jgi:hypothetical protein
VPSNTSFLEVATFEPNRVAPFRFGNVLVIPAGPVTRLISSDQENHLPGRFENKEKANFAAPSRVRSQFLVPIGNFIDENHGPRNDRSMTQKFYDFKVLFGEPGGAAWAKQVVSGERSFLMSWERCRERDSNPHGVTPAAF